jgi:hypothetical protein
MEKIRIQLLDQHHQYFSLIGLQNYRINSQLRTDCKKLVFFSQRLEIIIFSANGNATTVVQTSKT